MGRGGIRFRDRLQRGREHKGTLYFTFILLDRLLFYYYYHYFFSSFWLNYQPMVNDQRKSKQCSITSSSSSWPDVPVLRSMLLSLCLPPRASICCRRNSISVLLLNFSSWQEALAQTLEVNICRSLCWYTYVQDKETERWWQLCACVAPGRFQIIMREIIQTMFNLRAKHLPLLCSPHSIRHTHTHTRLCTSTTCPCRSPFNIVTLWVNRVLLQYSLPLCDDCSCNPE